VTADAWLTVAVLVAMVAALMADRVSPPAGILGGAGVLYVIGVTTADQAFSGFANTAPITVAGLYVIAGAIEKSGAIQPAVSRVLGEPRGVRADLARLTIPSAAASAFLANTPIVAMLAPSVTRWADHKKRSASTYLIPLSYATILGGAVTVIGTSTNLVASGLLADAGLGELGLFELARIGLPLAIVGLIAIVALAPLLLPERRRPRETDGGRAFSVAMAVEVDGPVDGVSVRDAGLRNLAGVFLVEIRRKGHTIAPVRPNQTLRGGDTLVFAGNVDDIVDLQGHSGLVAAESDAMAALDDDGDTAFFEAVIGASSPLVGRTASEMDFRGRYQAAILAVHRSGQHVRDKIGATRLKAGDTLLLVAGRDFRVRWRDSGDFLLVARLDAPMPPTTNKAPLAIAALALVVLLPAFDLLSVTRATILAAILLVALGVLRPREARDAVDVNVVLMIGGAFGLGEAVRVSGLAERLSDLIIGAFGWGGAFGAVVGIVVATMLLTELITNAAAVAVIFPIAISVAEQAEIDPRVAIMGVAVAGSASFLTPIGYQTNMMVYGPGGYRFTDYLRLGVPLSLLTVVGVSSAVVLMG